MVFGRLRCHHLEGRMPGKTKKTFKLTGKSHTASDRKLKAKPPGRRTAASGNRYTETRRNRADAKPSKRL